jgi:threonine dehydrogenase-like Zn-dependent dehydrogenase
VLLRILDVGICGTDREIAGFEYGEPPPGAEDFVLGHEALGEVIAVGPDVTSFEVGELAVPTVRRPCSNPRCPACRAGRQDFCITNEFSERGIVRADGYLAEQVLEEERYLIPVPEALREVAVLVEPLSVVSKAAEEYAVIHSRFAFDAPRSRGLVLGAGAIGLLGAMTLRAAGFETYVFSREPEDTARAAMIGSLGCHYVSSGRTAVERLRERIGAMDMIFEAVGVPAVAWGALPALAANGIYALTGVPALGDPVPGDLRRWMRDIVLNNQLIFGTVNAGRSAYEQSVIRLEQFLALFPTQLRELIRRVPFEEAPGIIAEGRGIKDVVSVAH